MIIPNNEIWLKTSDDSYKSIDTTDFVQNFVGTVHEDGWWKYSFDADITRIGTYALNGNVYVTDVILPETVTAIGDNAFNDDSNLASINFPDSLQTIGAGAFCYCSKLTEVTLKHVWIIGQEAFMGCYNISSLDLGDSLRSIELRGFYSHSTKGKIVELTLPATLSSLGNSAFNSQGITRVNFLREVTPLNPNMVDGIAQAFYNNTITEVGVPFVSRSYYEAAVADVAAFSGATFINIDGVPDLVNSMNNDIVVSKGAGRIIIQLTPQTDSTAGTYDMGSRILWDENTGILVVWFPEVEEDVDYEYYIRSTVDDSLMYAFNLFRRNLPFINDVCLPANVNLRTDGLMFTRMLLFRGDITGSTVKLYNSSVFAPTFSAYASYDDGTEEYTYFHTDPLIVLYGSGQYIVNHNNTETVFDVIQPYYTTFLQTVSATGGAYESTSKEFNIPGTGTSVITLKAVESSSFAGETTTISDIYIPEFELYNHIYTKDLDGWNYWRSNADIMTVRDSNNKLILTVSNDLLKKSFATPIFTQNGAATVQMGTSYSTQVIPFVKEGGNVFKINIPSEMSEETDVPISITYSPGYTGGYLTFETPDDVIITIDTETENENGIITATGTIRVNEENTASQIVVTVARVALNFTRKTTRSINKTITILEEEPPMAAPTITINKYANLSFPQEGATRYITITYGNTTSQFINTPYSTVLDTTITAESTTETDTGVDVYYSISVPATTYSRDIPLIFSCSNAAGLSCTETFTGMQEGETYGTEYCNITAVPSGLSFPATRDTQRVTVTAAYPDVNNPITVSVRHATMGITISWCKAVFVSRTYDDDYSSVTEEWDITMNPNEASEPSSAAVTFSYTNSPTYGGDSASVTVIATQDAADPGLPESSLSLYRTIMNFNATGGFDLGDAVCKADYRWTNEEDIEEPVIDGDWIAVTEGTHQTGAGYIIIPWQIAVSHNTTNESRTGTVTFSSIGQDDVEHTIALTVIQTGMDSSVETPEYVDLLWKDCEVVLGDDDMTFSILDENYDEFYTGRCRKRPDGDTNWFFINKIVQDYVYMEEIPKLLNGDSTYQEHENGYRHFRLDTPDTVGAMRGFYFKYDWSYTEDSPFILSESIIPYVVEGQRNLITYCNLSYNDVQTDTYSWIMKDGSMERGGINANEEEYATRVAVMPENADYYVLGGQRYEVITPCQSKYVLYYLSPKGGWCWFPIMGKVNASDRLTTFTISRNYDNTKMQFGKSRYTVDISTDYELSTGFLTESQSLRMWEMLESNMCYLHDMEKDVIFPVLMKQDTVEKKRYQRGQQKMLSYTFTVETSQGRMRM